MKKKRNQNKILNDIEEWKEANLLLDLENLRLREQDHVKIWVHPYSSIPITNRSVPEPVGDTKYRLLNGLFEIYDSWKEQLDKLNESYYLKIWLYEPRVSKSQIVCAIGSVIDFYKGTFQVPKNIKKIDTDNFGLLKIEIITNFKHIKKPSVFS